MPARLLSFDGETGFTSLIDTKDHSELNDHSGSKTHLKSVVMNAGPDNTAGTHVKSSEATGLFPLEQTFHFKDKISGSELLDVGLADLSLIPASVNSAGHHGPSAILMEVQTTELCLLEQDSAHLGRAVGIHSHDLML